MSQFRHWVFTINNPTDEDRLACETFSGRYIVWGEERGESGTLHYQGMCSYDHPQRFGRVQRDFPRAHIEVMRGSFAQAVAYCKKDGVYTEKGVPLQSQGKAGAEASAERWKRARKCAEEGKFDDIPDDIYVRCFSSLKRMRTEKLQSAPVASSDETTGVLYWGPSGIGKSRTARQQYPNAYIKNCNKWWDGYDNQEVVIMDDLDPDLAKALAHHLKIWTDHYPFTAEVKGGSIFIRPKIFLITSQYSLDQLFLDNHTLEAMKRRCRVVHFQALNDVDNTQ